MSTPTKKQKLGPNQKRWIAALRSGKFEQGSGQLATLDRRYCCLGVACETVGIKRVRSTEGFKFQRSLAMAPKKVMDALCLRSDDGAFSDSGFRFPEHEWIAELTTANDAGITFEQIADFIEAHPEAVFKSAK